jgi:hypothetical protein
MFRALFTAVKERRFFYQWCIYFDFELCSIEEDRLIVEGMNSLSRQKTKFYHFEEKFMDFGQTVVLWCFQDFCDNPE